ncbi:DUF3137 domain-containing protein [Nocardia alba]|uniref:DUF3137 domain-containing protein n=1 Tax=Nocardia alba TaxID=225051 RepID=A0A4R1FES3_9NOCA|nr:DUF3137 domain-containing protein [Nocardia alba]TCJ93276.1 hypothetical protein DFR71_5918 [Nocardia alba]
MGETVGGGGSDPFWSGQRFLNAVTVVTLVALVFAQYWWWRDHGRPFSWVLLLATPALAFLPAGIVVKAMRKRWTARWADEHGFDYQRAAAWPVPEWDFPPFTIGRARRFRVRDAMRGRIGRYPAGFFHLTWLNNNKINISTHYRNVFVVDLPAALPRLTVGLTSDLTTGDRVEFESADFNERFFVHSSNPAFAHAIFTPRTIEGLVHLGLRSPAASATKFEIVGNQLVGVTILGNRPHEITTVFEAMRIVADGIPGFVWTDYATPLTRSARVGSDAVTEGNIA